MASTRPSVDLTTFPPSEGLCQVLPPGPDTSHISMLSRICTWCRLFPEPHTGSRVPARPLPGWYTALCTPPKPGQLPPHCSPFWCTAIPSFLLLRLTPQESCRRLSGGSREVFPAFPLLVAAGAPGLAAASLQPSRPASSNSLLHLPLASPLWPSVSSGTLS